MIASLIPAPIDVGALRSDAAAMREQLADLEAASASATAARDKAGANLAAIEGQQAATAAALAALAPLLAEARRAAVAGEDRRGEITRLNTRRHDLEAERDELAEQFTVATTAATAAAVAASRAGLDAWAAGEQLAALGLAVLAGESDAEFDAALGLLFDALNRRDALDARAIAAAKGIAEHNARAAREGLPIIRPPFAEPFVLNLQRIPAMAKPHRAFLV